MSDAARVDNGTLHAVTGIDPGPEPGIVTLWISAAESIAVVTGREVAQVSHEAAADHLRDILTRNPDITHRVGIEKFLVRRRAGRVKGRPGEVTRRLTYGLILLARDLGATVTERTASQVKRWATDDRLKVAGLYAPTRGMTHARDAARHALFDAVRSGLVPDPMEALL